MMLKRLIFLLICFGSLSSCLHVSQKIHKIPVRASKSHVSKILGPPFKVQRKDGMDHWTYKFVIEGRHYTQTLIFKRGMFYKKERMKPYSLKSF